MCQTVILYPCIWASATLHLHMHDHLRHKYNACTSTPSCHACALCKQLSSFLNTSSLQSDVANVQRSLHTLRDRAFPDDRRLEVCSCIHNLQHSLAQQFQTLRPFSKKRCNKSKNSKDIVKVRRALKYAQLHSGKLQQQLKLMRGAEDRTRGSFQKVF